MVVAEEYKEMGQFFAYALAFAVKGDNYVA
ncbi:membrane protein YoeI [Klebsiella huaxiensis]|nr:membrane protein YoeI [Klebsiella sp. RHBSTW-00465]MBA7934682.1 membrane protein YoeI [Klebsiella sp. RHBSTW-00215]QBG07491.1 membrane protein YoeI [Klebsiella huaxiensis]HCB1497682.1 membrane protein YoeI [Klebsiella michiganensis]HCB1844893.1 membrane protein YoeI [Klebsiella oxytoca]